MSKEPILMFVMGTPTLKKMTELDLGPTVFKLHYFYHSNKDIFESFTRQVLIFLSVPHKSLSAHS